MTALVPLVGLGAYVVTGIFYVFPSGNPQPADFLFVVSMVATVVLAWRRLPNEPLVYLATGLFAGWITLVNVVWFFLYPSYGFLKATTFYMYNMLVFLFVIAVGFHDFNRLKVVVWWSFVIALVLQLVCLELVNVGGGKRATGTFANPNQLGYWALLAMGCLLVVKERMRLEIVDVLALGIGFYIVMLSLSKAASISAMLMVASAVVCCGCRRSAGVLLAYIVALGLTVELAKGGVVDRIINLEPVSNLAERLSSIGQQSDDDLAGRGYTRLIKNPQYLAFGAGEGESERLTDDGTGREFHSSLGNILMSYGVIGLGLFCLLLFVVFGCAPWASVAYLAPIMLYGVAHMGLRFSLFWIFLGLVYAQARYGGNPAPAHASPANGPRVSDPNAHAPRLPINRNSRLR